MGTIPITCPSCGVTGRAPEAVGGKWVKCAKCKARIPVPRLELLQASSFPKAPALVAEAPHVTLRAQQEGRAMGLGARAATPKAPARRTSKKPNKRRLTVSRERWSALLNAIREADPSVDTSGFSLQSPASLVGLNQLEWEAVLVGLEFEFDFQVSQGVRGRLYLHPEKVPLGRIVAI